MTVLSTRSLEAPLRAESPALPSRRVVEHRAWLTLGADVCAAAAACALAMLSRADQPLTGVTLFLALAVLWPVALGAAGSYHPSRVTQIRSQVRAVGVAAGSCAAVIAVPALVMTDVLQDRLAVESVVLVLATGLGRSILHPFTRSRHPIRVMLVGAPLAVGRTEAKLTARRTRRWRLVHTYSTSGSAGMIPTQRHQQSELAKLLAAVDQHRPDTLVLCPGTALSDADLRRLGWELAERSVSLMLSTEAFGAHHSRTVAAEVDGLNVVAFASPQLSGPGKAVKSVVERLVAAVGLLVLSPLLAAIAVAIRCTSSGPALFRQARTGLNGRHFVVFKFRTMRQGSAEQFLELARQAGQDSMFFKLECDPRVTKLGTFLRKTSLDELPQLLNVVIGNMSLVGPRPLPVAVEQTSDDVSRRLCALPGITGLWQVSGRSELANEQAVELDIDYVDNWRLGLDLAILRRTVRAVLRSEGAY